jgi:multiple sugar transport system substrate-binding protein
MPEQIFPQPQEILVEATPPQTVQPETVVPPPPAKGSPKVIILVVLAMAIILIIFLVSKLFSKKVVTSGEITWWGLWEDESTAGSLVAEYEAVNPKIKINYVPQAKQDYRERLTNALAKGTGPDIFRFHNSWVPMFKEELDPVPASVMNASDFATTFYPVVASDLALETGFVGIPLEYDGLALFINEDIFALAGKSPPTTWDDLRQLAIELTKKDEQGTIIQAGVALGRTENVDHWPEILALMMLQNGVNLATPTGKLAEDALTYFTVFSTVDGVWDATLPASTAAFAGGKLAMYFGPSWRALNILEQNPALKFRTVALPQLPKGGTTQSDVAYASYWVEGVWARSQNKETAWDFLKFLSTRESLTKMYTAAARQRLFGEPYPRVDMADLLKNHPVLGPIITRAPSAQSWYLQSRTWDGPTGINSLINKYFEDAINAVNSGTPAAKALEPVSQGVSQVLSQYGLK